MIRCTARYCAKNPEQEGGGTGGDGGAGNFIPPVLFLSISVLWGKKKRVPGGERSINSYEEGGFVTFIPYARYPERGNAVKRLVGKKGMCPVERVALHWKLSSRGGRGGGGGREVRIDFSVCKG